MSEIPNLNQQMKQVNIDELNLEQIDALSAVLGEKLRKIVDKACDEANELCGPLGVKVMMEFCMQPKEAQKNEPDSNTGE